MRRYSLALVAGLLVAAAGCNQAVPVGEMVTTAAVNAKGTADCAYLFAKLDLDGDHMLTVAEYLKGRDQLRSADPGRPADQSDDVLTAELKAMDANQDGMVTLDEFVTSCTGKPTDKPTPAACVPCDLLFATYDRDGNGSVSFDEYIKGMGGNAANQDTLALAAKHLDTDGDGQLSEAELCAGVSSPVPSGNPSTRPTPSGNPSTKPTPSGDPSTKPTPSGDPSTRPTPSSDPSTKPTPTVAPTASPNCKDQFAAFDVNHDGIVDFDEYFQGMGGTAANENALEAEAKAKDTNQDGQLTESEFCGSSWPLSVTVNIYNPLSPFGPQSVDIGVGGTVTFDNVNSGVPWTIRSVGSPSFTDLPLATSPATATTAVFTAPGNYEYKIDGTNPFVVHGHIIVH